MKVINFFGSSGSGKSTHSLALTAALKQNGTRAEYVDEYAKYLVYSQHKRMLMDQFKVFAEQRHKLDILRDHNVQYAVVDSPLLLGVLYGSKFGSITPSLTNTILEEFNTFENINFFVNRTVPFDTVGRNESMEESDKDSEYLRELLSTLNVKYVDIDTNTSIDEILKFI